MFHLLRQRTQHTSTLQVPAQLNRRATLLWAGVIKVRLSTQHLTSRFRQLMWDMKERPPLARVKTLEDHSSVVSAPSLNFLRKARSFCATAERHTNPVSNVRVPIAITHGHGVVDPSTENTSGRSMD